MYSSAWVGLDGGTCNSVKQCEPENIFQDGTDQDVSGITTENKQYGKFYAWWQNYSGGAGLDNAVIAVNPAHYMYATAYKNIETVKCTYSITSRTQRLARCSKRRSASETRLTAIRPNGSWRHRHSSAATAQSTTLLYRSSLSST